MNHPDQSGGKSSATEFTETTEEDIGAPEPQTPLCGYCPDEWSTRRHQGTKQIDGGIILRCVVVPSW